MERRSNQSGSAMLASVVRQFSPSRIEQQLLGQVFEFVVTRRHGQPAEFDPLDDQPREEARRPLNGSNSPGQERRAA